MDKIDGLADLQTVVPADALEPDDHTVAVPADLSAIVTPHH
jgi:hypothetical protein